MTSYTIIAFVGVLSTLAEPSIGEATHRYDGCEVWRIIPQTHQQVDFLVKLLDESGENELDFWWEPSGVLDPVVILVPPGKQRELRARLEMAGISCHVTIRDVQAAIDRQRGLQTSRVRRADTGFQYDNFHTLDEINEWMHHMATMYPSRVTLLNITKSYEGRAITALKITGKNSTEPKPGFFFTGGMHAREWLSPATAVYMTGQLIEQYGTDPAITAVVDSLDLYVLPVFNVDGYQYSWSKNRLWRKTRSQGEGVCKGADPNRNWDWRWCTLGASRDACSSRYCGRSTFSEVEVRGVADYLTAVPGRFRAFIDFHAFGQVWLTPWGHSKAFPRDFIIQNRCSKAATDALTAVHGTQYKHGTVATSLYPISGGSSDWAYGVAKIPFSVSVELRDKGDYGFLIPPDQILPTGQETLQGLIAFAKCIL